MTAVLVGALVVRDSTDGPAAERTDDATVSTPAEARNLSYTLALNHYNVTEDDIQSVTTYRVSREQVMQKVSSDPAYETLAIALEQRATSDVMYVSIVRASGDVFNPRRIPTPGGSSAEALSEEFLSKVKEVDPDAYEVLANPVPSDALVVLTEQESDFLTLAPSNWDALAPLIAELDAAAEKVQ